MGEGSNRTSSAPLPPRQDRAGLASRVLCKSWERVTGPMFIHAIKDAVKDAFTTAARGEGAHGANPPPHFDKEPFDDVGGAQAFPVCLGAIEEGQEFFQVCFQTGDGLGSLAVPAGLPLAETAKGFGAMLGLVDA